MAAVVIVGDDLTGSNATGAQYAVQGLNVVTVADVGTAERIHGEVDVLVFNTESRHRPAAEAASRVAEVVKFAAGIGAQLVKRVDTTLRGNIAAEAAAGLDALRRSRSQGRQVALVVPAFPASGRVTVGGRQLVGGVPVSRSWAATDPFTPVTTSRIASLFADHPELSIVEIGLEDLTEGLAERLSEAARGADVIVVDAFDDADITTVAAAATVAAESGDLEWLVVDTGPFGIALARQRGLGGGRTKENPLVVVMAGSLTNQTGAQLDHLVATTDAHLLTVDAEVDDAATIVARLAQAVAAGHSIVGVRTATLTRPPSARAAEATLALFAAVTVGVVEALHPAGVYATGGDVAMTVLGALGGDGYRILNEVLPLAVIGEVSGGPNDGIGLATKGGLIGAEDAAVLCVTALQQASRHSEDVTLVHPVETEGN